MMPVAAGPRSTKLQMLAYTILLLPLVTVPYWLGIAGPVYLTGAVLLGLAFIGCAVAVLRDAGHAAARRMFAYSILYLFLVFALLMIDSGRGLLAAGFFRAGFFGG
jgi:protoheme IX farnesyltransferase